MPSIPCFVCGSLNALESEVSCEKSLGATRKKGKPDVITEEVKEDFTTVAKVCVELAEAKSSND